MSDRLLFTRIVRQGGVRLLNATVDRLLPDGKPAPGAPRRRRSLARMLAGAVVVKLATRSIPGAIVVGGGLLAKARYDRRRAKKGDSPAPDATGA